MARCVGTDAATFAERYWSQRPLLTRAADLPAPFTDLLSLDAVDELLSRRGLRTPFLRVAKDGAVVASGRYTRSGGAGAEIADQVADDAVLGLFADGSTVVLQALHRVWPPLIDFAGALTAELGHPVQVNAYVTPPQSRGFSAHYDVHDVFVLQVAGSKRWVIHEPVHQHPLRTQPWTDRRAAVAARARDDVPVVDTVLEPGDALYLPRGYLHAAEALGGVTAHLTVGVHPVTRYAVAEALLTLAAEDPALRDSLPLGVDLAGTDGVAGPLDDVVAVLVERLRATPPDAVAARLRSTVWPASRPAPIAPLAQAGAAAAAGPSTVLRWRPGLRGLVVPGVGADEVVLELPARRLTYAAAARPALERLAGGTPVAVADLPGLDADDRVALARRLLTEAVAVPA